MLQRSELSSSVRLSVHTDLLGAEPDVPHVVADGLGGRHGTGQLPSLDDGGTTLLHCLQEEEEEEKG